MAKIYGMSGDVRMLHDKLKSIEAEFKAARKLGWHVTCVGLRREAKDIQKTLCRESRIAGSSLLLRLTQ